MKMIDALKEERKNPLKKLGKRQTKNFKETMAAPIKKSFN